MLSAGLSYLKLNVITLISLEPDLFLQPQGAKRKMTREREKSFFISDEFFSKIVISLKTGP